MTFPNLRRISELDADKAKWLVQGTVGTVSAGQTGNVDWRMPEDRWVSGGEVVCKDHAFGDTCSIQVVDKDNILGYGAGLVLDTFVKDLRIVEDAQAQGRWECPYMAAVPGGLYVRIVYTSIGATDVSIGMNMITHVPR